MLLLGAVVLVVLVMSVVIFRLLAFEFPVVGAGGGSAYSFFSVSVIALRLVLVIFLPETVADFFCSSRWASVLL